MVGKRLIILLGIVTGVALELGIHAISRRREAWDSPQFWTIRLPLAALCRTGNGLPLADRDWTWSAVIVPSQVMTMIVTERRSRLRLVASHRRAFNPSQRTVRRRRLRRFALASRLEHHQLPDPALTGKHSSFVSRNRQFQCRLLSVVLFSDAVNVSGTPPGIHPDRP